MGSDSDSSGGLETREKIRARLHELHDDILCQQRIIYELKRDGHPSVAADTVLALLQDEKTALLKKLGQL